MKTFKPEVPQYSFMDVLLGTGLQREERSSRLEREATSVFTPVPQSHALLPELRLLSDWWHSIFRWEHETHVNCT